MAGSKVSLIAGLGNPGAKYERTRHNAGFWFVDGVAARFGVSLQSNKRFHGDVAEVSVAGQRVRLLKPTTFMNLSGQAVAALAGFYKIAPEQVLVVHDELDLDAGVVRLKRGGGEGGHNGLRDISPKLGSKNYLRLRVGVGHPGHASKVLGYVLNPPRAEEQRAIEDGIERALGQLEAIVRGEEAAAMNELNRKVAA